MQQTELLDTSRGIDTEGPIQVQGIAAESNEIVFYPSTYMWTKNEQSSEPQPQHRFILRIEQELVFQRNVVNLIVGPTASGKTSVLMALLGQGPLTLAT